MKYLGTVTRQDNHLTMPEAFRELAEQKTYEAIQIGDAILLLSAPLDRERLRQIEELAKRSIDEHRPSLEGLAQ